MPPLVNQLRHIGGPLAVEIHLLTCPWVNETQCLGMQHLSWTQFEAVLDESLVAGRPLPPQYFCSAITLIAEQGMSDMLHVGTNLMGSTRFQHTFHQRDIAETLQHPVMSNSTLTDI